MVISIPRSRRETRNGEAPLGSWPLTSRPSSASRVAMALMPAPPTFVTWIRRRPVRSSGSATGLGGDEGGDVGGGAGVGPGAGGLGHGPPPLGIGEDAIHLGGQAPPVEVAVGDEHR